MVHVFQKIRPLFAEQINRPPVEELEQKIRSRESWAQKVYVNLEVQPNDVEDLNLVVEKISTSIQSEPLAIDFVGTNAFINRFQKDELNVPVLATYKRSAMNPRYPFGVGLLGKIARKLDANWGTEYSIGEIASAAFDGSLLVFIDNHRVPYLGGYHLGVLIQSISGSISLQRYNIR